MHPQTQLALCRGLSHSPEADMNELKFLSKPCVLLQGRRKVGAEYGAHPTPVHKQTQQSCILSNIFRVVSLQEQFGAALGLVRQILERRPDHYVALAQLMSLLRRAGRIAEGEKHLQASLQKMVRGSSSAGEQADCLDASLGHRVAVVGRFCWQVGHLSA